MPLEPIQLDDLTWADLTTAARERIAGASGGRWTLHAPVDPGITLLDLFAAQLEQRLYWMNQTNPSTQAAMLSLLGIQPQPVSIAGTVLCLMSDPAVSASLPDSPLVVEQTDADRPLRFTSQQNLQILPVDWKSTARRTARMRRGAPRSRWNLTFVSTLLVKITQINYAMDCCLACCRTRATDRELSLLFH